MELITDDISSWVSNLKDLAPEYTPIRITSVLSFYKLRGRTTSMIMSNLECIPDLHYALKQPREEKYYYRGFKGYDLETLYFYRPTLTFSGESMPVENLRQYVRDGNIWILMTPQMVNDTSDMLARLWRSQFNDGGKLDYRIYIDLLKLNLDYADYKDYGKELTGYLTMCKKYEQAIIETWEKAHQKGMKN